MDIRNARLKKATIRSSRQMRGLSLVELMIAMLLGLLVTAAAGGMFLANKRAYGTTETLNRIQENSRISFELMARDVREAGGRPCGASAQLVNMLTSKDNGWWAKFANGLQGYDDNEASPGTAIGTAAGQRVAGTDAIDLHMANRGDYSVAAHSTPSSNLDLNTSAGLTDGDIVMVCNTSYALIFQITGLNANGLVHNSGGSAQPGNYASEFQFETPGPATCSGGGASCTKGYCMMVTGSASAQCVKHSDDPAALAHVETVRWYIGNNDRGGRSLYRATVVNKTNTGIPNLVNPTEIAEGVTDMQLTYRSLGSAIYGAATASTDWSRVNAVRINLAVEGTEGALSGAYIQGTDGEALSRQLTHVVAIRNREGVL